MAVERGLGDTGPLDQLVDSHRADTTAREQLVRAIENALADRRSAGGGLKGPGHRPDHNSNRQTGLTVIQD